MTRDEIVTALRCCASSEADCKGNCAFFGTSSPNEDCSQRKNTAAADLIENQQRHIEALMQANAADREDERGTGTVCQGRCGGGGAKRTARHEKRAVPILREVQTSTRGRL